MGWINKGMHRRLRQSFVEKNEKDDSMFPQIINGVIYLLDTKKEDNFLSDKLCDGRNDDCQNSLTAQQENASNEEGKEDNESEEVSGGHTYTPLTQEEVLAVAMMEGEENFFTPEDFDEEEHVVGAMVIECSDEDSNFDNMSALTERCTGDY